jgi:hypothetical protein
MVEDGPADDELDELPEGIMALDAEVRDIVPVVMQDDALRIAIQGHARSRDI